MKKLLLLSVITAFINACEFETCPFYEGKEVFYINLAHISVSDRCKPNTLDTIDKIIFEDHLIPYSHTAIEQKENKDVYVLQKDYEKVRNDAIQWFQNRTSQLVARRDAIQNDDSKNDYFKTLTLAVKRTEQYTQYLEKITTYKHLCPGAIISARGLLCAQQYLATQPKTHKQ